ncbi:hypothetical protein PybrP1_003345 [[Pythium] brassicae (nom. inval.)]|nr:hypothetical protein PybrP1_003345 [[Pythium] brassicae (nom. inval.)]
MDARYHAVATPPTAAGDDFLQLPTPPPAAAHSHAHALSAVLGARRASQSLSPSRASGAGREFHELREVALAAAAHKSRWTPLRGHSDSDSSGRQRRLRRLRTLAVGASALGVLAAGFALTFALPRALQRLAPVVIGSLLSFVSALAVLVSYVAQPQNRRHPNELLVYVALCEGGLALLALVHVMAFCASDSDNNNAAAAAAICAPLSMRACTVLSALEMFLLLASVGWFGAAILHLFVSVSNPFASYKAQLKIYHGVVWSGSVAVAVLVPLVVFSQAFQDRLDMSSVELCRAAMLVLPSLPAATSAQEQATRVAQWRQLNAAYWGALFALVVLLVVAAQGILAVGWWRSNSGTVIALKARRRMMKRMTVYVHALNATWLVILVAFFTYRSNDAALRRLPSTDHAFRDSDSGGDNTAASSASLAGDELGGVHVLDGLFHYLLAAKGYFTCVVWVTVNKRCCACRSVLCGASASRSTRGAAAGAGALTDNDNDNDDDGDGDVNRRENPLVWSSSSLAMLEGGTGALGTPAPTAMTRRSLAADPRAPSLVRSAQPPTPCGPPRLSASSVSSWASQNNETLQREIIYYTVCGIAKSILKALQTPPDATVVAQQMLVGAERDSAFTNNAILSHVQTTHALSSPRPFCQPHVGLAPPLGTALSGRRAPEDSCNNTEIATASSTTPGGSFSQRMSFLSTSSQAQQLPPYNSNSFTHQHAPGRFSLYPVSQVPFELFDQEFELQSNRSSSLGLSPLFAGLRRTAFGGPPPPADATADAGGSNAGAAADDHPKPKVFVDYAPSEFRAVRRAFGLSDETYLASFRTTAKERVSAGSSGAFMFFSGDNALIVKSMKEKECRKLVKMAPAYAAFIRQHPASRIIRFFGCHRIRLYGRNFYFVVMSNVLHSVQHTATIAEKYDVKGSWVDRRARRPQVGDTVTCSDCDASYAFGLDDASTTFPFHLHRPDTILKDLDLKRKLRLPARVAANLHAQLVADCDFLHSMGIMDYSLLVGVHKCRLQLADTAVAIREDDDGDDDGDDGDSDGDRDDSGRAAAPPLTAGANLAPLADDSDTEVYFVGIIDILQEWDWEKQMEKVGKMLIGKSGSGISAVPPDAYCQRFKARVAQILLGDGVASEASADSDTRSTPDTLSP